MSNHDSVNDYLLSLQNRIVAELEQLDGRGSFRRDAWERPGGGGGDSRVLTGGDVFEQSGRNLSHVVGEELPPSATQRTEERVRQKARTQLP